MKIETTKTITLSDEDIRIAIADWLRGSRVADVAGRNVLLLNSSDEEITVCAKIAFSTSQPSQHGTDKE